MGQKQVYSCKDMKQFISFFLIIVQIFPTKSYKPTYYISFILH